MQNMFKCRSIYSLLFLWISCIKDRKQKNAPCPNFVWPKTDIFAGIIVNLCMQNLKRKKAHLLELKIKWVSFWLNEFSNLEFSIFIRFHCEQRLSIASKAQWKSNFIKPTFSLKRPLVTIKMKCFSLCSKMVGIKIRRWLLSPVDSKTFTALSLSQFVCVLGYICSSFTWNVKFTDFSKLFTYSFVYFMESF